jgi:hypothetical protein
MLLGIYFNNYKTANSYSAVVSYCDSKGGLGRKKLLRTPFTSKDVYLFAINRLKVDLMTKYKHPINRISATTAVDHNSAPKKYAVFVV